jgi:integral membrane sensor domain MASE1
MIGVALYGVGTLTEAITSVFGWSEPVFRSWYVAGALLGAAPLAQGSVYLLLPRRIADRLAVAVITYISIASAFVVATPLLMNLVESHRLSGEVMEWQWVRLFSPLVNLYAVVFLIGGAIWSAIRYRRQGISGARVRGNWLIAVGAILPGIGGSFARAGVVEVLYVTELVGLLLIWAGYRAIAGDSSRSIHNAQAAQISQNPTTKEVTN